MSIPEPGAQGVSLWKAAHGGAIDTGLRTQEGDHISVNPTTGLVYLHKNGADAFALTRVKCEGVIDLDLADQALEPDDPRLTGIKAIVAGTLQMTVDETPPNTWLEGQSTLYWSTTHSLRKPFPVQDVVDDDLVLGTICYDSADGRAYADFGDVEHIHVGPAHPSPALAAIIRQRLLGEGVEPTDDEVAAQALRNRFGLERGERAEWSEIQKACIAQDPIAVLRTLERLREPGRSAHVPQI